MSWLVADTTTRLSVAAINGINLVVKSLSENERVANNNKGGYVRVFYQADPAKSFAGLVQLYENWVGGKANIEEGSMYKTLSMEKAIRLADWAQGDRRVLTSGEAGTDASRFRFRGAVRARGVVPELVYIVGEKPVWLYFSFSGLPELCNEAVAWLVARNCWWGTNRQDLEAIRTRAQNPLIPELADA